MDAYPDVNSELENLVRTTSEILKNPVQKPIVKKTLETKPETVEKIPKKPENEEQRGGFLNKKVIAAIIIVIIVAIVGIFVLGMDNSGNDDSGEVKFVADNGKNSLSVHEDSSDVNSSKQSSSGVKITKYNIHDVRNNSKYSWSYSYFAYGTLGSDLIGHDNYMVDTTFYDSNGKVIDSSKNDIKSLEKVGDKYLLGDCFIDDNNVKKIVVTVTDNGNIVAPDEYKI